jgi:hypothetical protein
MNLFSDVLGWKSVVPAAALAGILASAEDASALERWVNIVNQGNETIWPVYITNIDSTWWGSDLLGSHLICPGDFMTVEPWPHGGYCRFDVKAVSETGQEFVWWDLNLCEITDIYFDSWGFSHVGY